MKVNGTVNNRLLNMWELNPLLSRKWRGRLTTGPLTSASPLPPSGDITQKAKAQYCDKDIKYAGCALQKGTQVKAKAICHSHLENMERDAESRRPTTRNNHFWSSHPAADWGACVGWKHDMARNTQLLGCLKLKKMCLASLRCLLHLSLSTFSLPLYLDFSCFKEKQNSWWAKISLHTQWGLRASQ